MAAERKVEIFSAGCQSCKDVVNEIRREAGPGWEVIVHDMQDGQVASRAKQLGIRSVPAVLIDGQVADCCASRGVDMQVLRAAGLGR